MPRVLKIYLARQKDIGSGALTGSIPKATASLLDLVDLDLSDNDLTGEVLPTLGNIPRLQVLNLSNNELTGVISDELGLLSGKKFGFVALYVTLNLRYFVLPIYSEVSKVFDLSYNKLSGGSVL